MSGWSRRCCSPAPVCACPARAVQARRAGRRARSARAAGEARHSAVNAQAHRRSARSPPRRAGTPAATRHDRLARGGSRRPSAARSAPRDRGRRTGCSADSFCPRFRSWAGRRAALQTARCRASPTSPRSSGPAATPPPHPASTQAPGRCRGCAHAPRRTILPKLPPAPDQPAIARGTPRASSQSPGSPCPPCGRAA